MGLLVALLARILPEHQQAWRLFLAVGVLGGFTTFSAFSLDIVELMQAQQFWQASIYMIVSAVLSVLALLCGLWWVRIVGNTGCSLDLWESKIKVGMNTFYSLLHSS